MLKIDKSKIEMSGSPLIMLNEMAALLHHGVKKLCEGTGVQEEKIIMDILDMRRVSILIESGMTPSEASEMVMPGKVKQIIAQDKDGTEKIFNVNKESS